MLGHLGIYGSDDIHQDRLPPIYPHTGHLLTTLPLRPRDFFGLIEDGPHSPSPVEDEERDWSF